MAFQAPSRARRQQQLPTLKTQETQTSESLTLGGASSIATPDTEEWVVFAPSITADTTTVFGTTQLASDAESIVTTASPQFTRHGAIPDIFDDALVEEDVEDEDEESEGASFGYAETDSLQPFRDYAEGPVVLPAHDGLGTFASSSGMVGYRSLEESLRIVASSGEDHDKTARINKWRIEQSQAFIDEIERATRQRRMSLVSGRSATVEQKTAGLEEKQSTLDNVEATVVLSTANPDVELTGKERAHTEAFWKRITRSFIRDIMGIDDNLLEVIFGEVLPTDALASEHAAVKFRRDAEERLLNRIARELGELVKLYSPQQYPPGNAFSSFQGIVKEDEGAKTPQARTTSATVEAATLSPRKRQRNGSFSSLASGLSSVPQFQFAPTLTRSPPDDPSHAALWGIEGEEVRETRLDTQLCHEYWEQELDMRLVFSYLKSRFYGRPSRTATDSVPVSLAPTSETSSQATTTATTPSAFSTLHHPLINRNIHRPPTTSYVHKSAVRVPPTTTSASGGFFGAGGVSVGTGMGMVIGMGMGSGTLASSSCASHSSRGGGVSKEKTKTKITSSSNRSRGYYWDVASVGTGKASCVGTGVWAAI